MIPSFNDSEDGVLIDDKGHVETLNITFDISKDDFQNVLNYIEGVDGDDYHLDNYNCTDFALGCAASSGNPLPDTFGEWPGGGGSNPGDLGEDIREVLTERDKQNENTGN